MLPGIYFCIILSETGPSGLRMPCLEGLSPQWGRGILERKGSSGELGDLGELSCGGLCLLDADSCHQALQGFLSSKPPLGRTTHLVGLPACVLAEWSHLPCSI